MSHHRTQLYHKNFDKATPEQVQNFLNDFYVKLDSGQWYIRLDRDDNEDFLLEMDLDSAAVATYLRALTPQNYYAGPLIDRRVYRRHENPGPLWEFGTVVEGIEVYVKLRLGAPESDAVCVSFHHPKFTLDYPLRK